MAMEVATSRMYSALRLLSLMLRRPGMPLGIRAVGEGKA